MSHKNSTCPLKPGNNAPGTATYGELNTHGNPTGREANVNEGRPLPPTQKHGYSWRVVGVPRNGRGKDALKKRC